MGLLPSGFFQPQALVLIKTYFLKSCWLGIEVTMLELGLLKDFQAQVEWCVGRFSEAVSFLMYLDAETELSLQVQASCV